jgi:hypothetical protein
MGFISGGYKAFWGGIPLGMVERGFTFTYSRKAQSITGGPSGETIDDAIHTGMDLSVSFTATELDLPAVNNLLWRVRNPLLYGDVGVLGASEYAASLPLTLISCTVGLTQTVTFFRTNLIPGHEINLRYATTHRKAEILMRAYPVRLIQERRQILSSGTSFTAVDLPDTFRLVYFEAT